MSLTRPTRPRLFTRRRLARAALAVAAVVIFVVLPGFMASQPGFFGAYPDLEAHQANWASSPHAGVGCEGCHVSPAPLARAAYRTRLVGEFYLSIVARGRVPSLFAEPTNAACLDCHSELRTSSPKGDLQIPHRAHITILKMDCVQCHQYLVHEASPEGKHAPRMVDCLTCHDGENAKDACTACHTEKAAPETHAQSEWLVQHATHEEDQACVSCHKWKQDWCADCHRDRPRSHSEDWRQVHGERVAEHRSCEACHEQQFCVRCHGELPALNYDPALELVE